MPYPPEGTGTRARFVLDYEKMSNQSNINVSIIIPCRNEVRFIGECLDSMIANDYSGGRMEILVVDGMSKDGTREIVKKYTQEYPFIKLLDNPQKIIPVAMNIGIRNAGGEIIMKIDSHAVYAKDYVSNCIKYLKKYNADNVGGAIIAVPRNNTVFGKAVVFSLSHPFGIGNSLFRIKTNSTGPVWADTAFSGCYKKEVFDRIGLYDENIARSEDVAINSKLRRTGGRILLVPEIVSHYYARSSFGDFIKHNFDNGFWITYPLKFGRVLFSWRHLVPLAFVSSLTVSAVLTPFLSIFRWLFLTISGFYILTNLYFSGTIAFRERNIRYLLLMPIIFVSLHLTYGLGSVWGLLKVFASKISAKNLKMISSENG